MVGYDAEKGIQFHHTQTKSHTIKVTGKLDFTNHPMLEDFRYLQSVAGDHSAKMTIPSSSMLHFRGEVDKQVYPNDEEFFEDLGRTYEKAIRAFYDVGCRYLQLDDTAWAYFCSDEQKGLMLSRGLHQVAMNLLRRLCLVSVEVR